MKKKIIIGVLVVVLVSVLLIVCSHVQPKEEEVDNYLEQLITESASIKNSERKAFIAMDVSSFLEKYRQEDKTVILLTREGCQFCEIAIPFLQKISKEYQLDIYNIVSTSLSEEEVETFITSNERFQQNLKTPFLMIVQKEELVDSVEGLLSYEQYVDFLKENNVI